MISLDSLIMIAVAIFVVDMFCNIGDFLVHAFFVYLFYLALVNAF